jgi:hypothetical protein
MKHKLILGRKQGVVGLLNKKKNKFHVGPKMGISTNCPS